MNDVMNSKKNKKNPLKLNNLLIGIQSYKIAKGEKKIDINHNFIGEIHSIRKSNYIKKKKKKN